MMNMDIEALAKQSGFSIANGSYGLKLSGGGSLEQFADLVAQQAAEEMREKCKKACESRQLWVRSENGLSFLSWDAASKEAGFCADAIGALPIKDAP